MIGISKRHAVVISIMMLIALDHILRISSYLSGKLYDYYYSYFSDFVLPFGFYFLLCVAERQLPIFKHWGVKSAIVFLLPSIAETCQYFGIPILGSTFDPVDYLMYAFGALSAILIDTQVFSRVFGFWNTDQKA